jgi:hypothetical protein
MRYILASLNSFKRLPACTALADPTLHADVNWHGSGSPSNLSVQLEIATTFYKDLVCQGHSMYTCKDPAPMKAFGNGHCALFRSKVGA